MKNTVSIVVLGLVFCTGVLSADDGVKMPRVTCVLDYFRTDVRIVSKRIKITSEWSEVFNRSFLLMARLKRECEQGLCTKVYNLEVAVGKSGFTSSASYPLTAPETLTGKRKEILPRVSLSTTREVGLSSCEQEI